MSDQYNISAIKGSTLLLNINCSNSDGSYINFSGYSARGYVRYNYSSTGILLDLQPVLDSSYISGLIRISGAATGLANMPVGTFVYSVEAEQTGVSPDKYVFSPLRGYFECLPEATY